jgi:hypothetical protein
LKEESFVVFVVVVLLLLLLNKYSKLYNNTMIEERESGD